MKKLLQIGLFSLLLVSGYADDNGGGSLGGSGGDLGGALGGQSLFGSGDSGSGNASTSTGVLVPPIVGASGLGANTASITLNQNGSDGKSLAQVSPDQVPTVDSAAALNNSKTGINQASAFQNNVAIRTGRMLPIYGLNAFNSPTSFSPNQNLPVPDGYVVGPGDVISMQTWGAVNSNISLSVNGDGTVFIPKVGTISVSGVKANQLDGYLSRKIGKIYRNFSLSSVVGKIKTIQVTVAGFAQQPGTYNLSSLSTLENAVFAVGGPAITGSLRDVELRRNGQTIAHFDLYSVLLKGGVNNTHILAGDVIYFPPVGNQVAIYDGVKVPGIYETLPYETVDDVVQYAGGYSYDNRKNGVVLEQTDANQKINVYNYSMEQGLKQLVSSGEIIHFYTSNNEYDKAVVLIGNVANPTRMNFHPGMTVHDVIPDKSLLLSKSYWNSYNFNTYGRDSILTSMGQEKSTFQSGKVSDISTSSGYNSSTTQKGAQDNVFGGRQNLFIAGPVQVPEADINWNYALIVRTNPKNYQAELIPFNLKLALEGDPKNNIKLQAGDIINVLSSKDVRAPARNGVMYVFIDGEVNRPGVYELPPRSTLQDLITTAGGSTQDAYLYGLELARASVKQRQMRTLNQMLDQLQQTLLAQSSNAALTTATAQGAQTQQIVLQQQQAFINKLRQLQPSGRVVLNLTSSRLQESDLPSVMLENGDTVYIPTTPTVIDVVGQVYNPATFQYDKHYTVGKYINLAGTENQFADSSQEYILRADGTLYSKQQAGWFGAFASQTLNPGDAIIVPQQIQFGGAIQNLLNWTQILANFGTTAAAITVFK